jgi:NAD(P)H-flavin reductase/nitrite reductase/ring-hydroxylating ferredoxin subunit
MFIGLPTLYGSWLMPIYGLTQHAGLAEDVLDHRLNCRTIYMNRVNRYLYWNMNYHIEHHMFPLVPYHALPRLHEAVKADMPKPYAGIIEAFKEIIPAIHKQIRDPSWFVRRELPQQARPIEENASRIFLSDDKGWICAGNLHALKVEKLLRVDFGRNTFVVVCSDENNWFVLDGMCTHGNAHLANGLVKDGQIECPKHNGRFQLNDGAPKRAPVCRALRTYPIAVRDNELWFDPANPQNSKSQTYADLSLRVVSNHNIATFIKELVLEPLNAPLHFTPGDYLQFNIPTFNQIAFNDFAIDERFARDWAGLRTMRVTNSMEGRQNNYSIATVPGEGATLRFNVRIALPPLGETNLPPGIGSSWMFMLRSGDVVTAKGPFGDFHIKPTQREMVYIGGGAGMAPIRAHVGGLFLNQESTARKVSFWYGARSTQELLYHDEFIALATKHQNFSYNPALSGPEGSESWSGDKGFIHEVVHRKYLAGHQNIKSVEFYLCGPPMMVSSCISMLASLGVSPQQILYDEF